MPTYDPAALVKLDSMISAARYSHHHATLADLLVRRANVRLEQGRQQDAMTDLEDAARACQAEQDWTGVARAWLMIARLLSGQADRFDACMKAFAQADAHAIRAGDDELFARVHEHRAATARASGAHPIAASSYAFLEECYGRTGDQVALANTLVNRASLHHLNGLPHKALTRLDEAVATARESGDPVALLRIRLLRRAYTAQTRREASVEPLHELLEEAQGLGLQGPAALAFITRASELARAGKHAQAAAQAEQGRQAALQGDDVVLYLFSCLLLAECREALDDRPGVLAILLTCKGTLEDRLGKAAGRPVVMILDSLEGRWGNAALQDALRTYRKEARERLQDPSSN